MTPEQFLSLKVGDSIRCAAEGWSCSKGSVFEVTVMSFLLKWVLAERGAMSILVTVDTCADWEIVNDYEPT